MMRETCIIIRFPGTPRGVRATDAPSHSLVDPVKERDVTRLAGSRVPSVYAKKTVRTVRTVRLSECSDGRTVWTAESNYL
jgi:hypothetical protein